MDGLSQIIHEKGTPLLAGLHSLRQQHLDGTAAHFGRHDMSGNDDDEKGDEQEHAFVHETVHKARRPRRMGVDVVCQLVLLQAP